uniref:Uncharacterized protein n=1 Tax=Arundo donax TaxID=35708 RepID=A0A0A9B407_ARUDO
MLGTLLLLVYHLALLGYQYITYITITCL